MFIPSILCGKKKPPRPPAGPPPARRKNTKATEDAEVQALERIMIRAGWILEKRQRGGKQLGPVDSMPPLAFDPWRATVNNGAGGAHGSILIYGAGHDRGGGDGPHAGYLQILSLNTQWLLILVSTTD